MSRQFSDYHHRSVDVFPSALPFPARVNIQNIYSAGNYIRFSPDRSFDVAKTIGNDGYRGEVPISSKVIRTGMKGVLKNTLKLNIVKTLDIVLNR